MADTNYNPMDLIQQAGSYPMAMNPADLTDPQAQRKIAENILNQIGMHPNQRGAKDLLDQHLTGPTADPQVKDLISSVDTRTAQQNQPAPVAVPQMTLPGPSASPLITPIAQNTNSEVQGHQQELARLNATGSGISQVKNPFLRALGRVGEVAGDLIDPNLLTAVPGTEAHHTALVNKEQGAIDEGLKNAQTEATTAYTNQHADTLANAPDKAPTELQAWIAQNPNGKISDYWKQKAAAGTGGKLTPEEQVMKSLTLPPEEGGEGLSPSDAYAAIIKQKNSGKAPTAAANDQALQATLAKSFPDGQAPPNLMENATALGHWISNSPELSDEEKGKLLAHFVFKTSPASAGSIADKRIAGQMNSRLTAAIDNTTAQLGLVTPGQVQSHPGQFIPATQGGQSMGREGLVGDLHYNINNVRQAYAGLRNGLDTKTRGQLALIMHSAHPASAASTFLNGEAATTLTPDQVDLVTSLASLAENGMAMRQLGGFGQGSDEVRHAIAATLPGPGTPNVDFANRQLDLVEGTVNRLAHGIPKSGVTPLDSTPAPKTGSHNIDNQTSQPAGKTFTKAQVQAAAKTAGISYEEAKTDAEKHGHRVKE